MVYFVVFLREMKKNVILPKLWVKDVDNHFEKFVNNSLNRSQLFLCFYPETTSHAIINGRPDENFEPDFNSTNCFIGKMKRYFGKPMQIIS